MISDSFGGNSLPAVCLLVPQSFQVVVAQAVLFCVAFGIEPVIFLRRSSSLTGAANRVIIIIINDFTAYTIN